MPISTMDAVPTIVETIRALRPASVLDVGVGFGMWGVLLRSTLEMREGAERYHKRDWAVTIDGVEVFEAYRNPIYAFAYDTVHIGDVCDLAGSLPAYDVVLLGDVIEHIPFEQGRRLLDTLAERTGKAIIVVTPRGDMAQEGVFGNPREEHVSNWTAPDFRRWPNARVRTVSRRTLVALIPTGATDARLVNPFRGRFVGRLRSLASRVLARLIGRRRLARLARGAGS